MSIVLPAERRFSFASRPVPVPGDLRINWRLAIVLLMLGESRAKRASLAKLHVLNDAVRSSRSRHTLEQVLSGTAAPLTWRMRVEPAFGRAIDFVVGEKFAGWIQIAGRSGLQLTATGLASYEVIKASDDVVADEKSFLQAVGMRVTEEFVSRLLDVGRRVG